jgi:hypothetical protein
VVFISISESDETENVLSTSLPNGQRLYRQRLSNTSTNNNAKDSRPSVTKSGRLLAAKLIEHQQRRNSSVDTHPHQGLERSFCFAVLSFLLLAFAIILIINF